MENTVPQMLKSGRIVTIVTGYIGENAWESEFDP